MNVIKNLKRGGGNHVGPSRPLMNSQKPKGRGRGALDFDLIQYRPGQRGAPSTSNSSDMRTPSNLELQMAIRSSAHRTSSSKVQTESGNYFSSSTSFSSTLPSRSTLITARAQSTSHSGGTNSTPAVTPLINKRGLSKTPRNSYPFTPKNSMIFCSTPRTTPTSASTSTDHHNSHVVLAVTEGRGHARGEVGIAVIDVKRPHLILCQLSDQQTYASAVTKINMFHPVEILIPHTFVDSSQPNKLFCLLEKKFPHVRMTKVQRRLFRDSEGLEKINYLCLPENSSCQLILHDRFYALAAAAALLKYIEFVQNVIFAAHSLKVEYQGAHHGTLIDVTTAMNLELLLNQQSLNANHTLVNMMDHCCTHGGSRLLRASLLHPPCSLPLITRRQDGAQELVENPEVAKKIREVLKQLPDVEQLLTLCMQTPSTVDNTQAMESRVKYILKLKTTVESLPLLTAALEKAQSALLCKARECLQDSRGDRIKDRILKTINEDVKSVKGGKTATFQRCFAIKSGVNDLMDVARKTYCELISDMHDHVLGLEGQYSLPLKMDYSATKGYHIQIPIQKHHAINKNDLPPLFVQVQQTRSTLTCTTDMLIHANERIKLVSNDILTMSNTLITKILNDIRESISYLYDMCESIAEVDLVSALAQISSSHNYVRPQFGDVLSLKASRHPILESITTCDPIANDIEATSKQNVSIVTGPNMSGKSVYIRQVLLLQIMAQVGSYVPAEQATFRITDRIFSHLNFDDSIEKNASTLSLEMQEMQLILSSLTSTSLVALDELCRGTSVEEGTAIAWALCEELSQSSAFVYVTTHFRELTRLASLYPSIKNVHLETIEQEFSNNKSRLVYTHRLLPGFNTVEDYGLRLAENLGVPEPILQMAESFATQIKNTSEANFTCGQGNEAYTLAMGFHKLKLLMEKEDLCTNDLVLARSELMQALDVARQQSRTASTMRESKNTVNDQTKANSHLQKLCDYLSSDETRSISFDEHQTEQTLQGTHKSVASKSQEAVPTFQSLETLKNTPLFRDCESTCSDLNSSKMSTCTTIINFKTSNTSTFLGNETFDNSFGSPMSSTCSQNTELAESPEGQSLRKTRNSKRDRFVRDSDLSDSEWDAGPNFRQTSSVADEKYNLTARPVCDISAEADLFDCSDNASFHEETTEKILVSLQNSDQTQGKLFISGNQTSSSPSPFQFINQKSHFKRNNFETFFNNAKSDLSSSTAARREESISPVSVCSDRKRSNEFSNTPSSSLWSSNYHQQQTPCKKKIIDPITYNTQVEQPTQKRQKSPFAKSIIKQKEENDPSTGSQVTVNMTKGNSLQALMDSYYDSDFDSD